jgi:hypothetical protein
VSSRKRRAWSVAQLWGVAAGLVGLVAFGFVVGLGTSAQIGDPSLCSYRGDCVRTVTSSTAMVLGILGLIIVVPVVVTRCVSTRLRRRSRASSERP